ncbi:MAG: hypothetical protein HY789_03965 [Deltaproteobacteria bacterium]|nr:hypothetical protein [Deltaproteobacteria bacterium]
MTHPCSHAEPIVVQRKPGGAAEFLLINKRYETFLEQTGFTTFPAVWSFSNGEVIKEKGERSVVRVDFPEAADACADDCQFPAHSSFFYIKKHRQRLSLWQRLQGILRPAHVAGEGVKEFLNYCSFRQHGLATASPVAAGMRFTSFLQADSFLITRDFFPLVALEDIILQQPATLQGAENEKRKRNILAAIARYARKMHANGMNQKDFNATHLLLREPDAAAPEIALFDLQRVDRNPLNRWRWPIKALAELNCTLPAAIFTGQDRMFLFKAYKDKEMLSALDQWQYRLICRKTASIARHTKKRGLAPKMT